MATASAATDDIDGDSPEEGADDPAELPDSADESGGEPAAALDGEAEEPAQVQDEEIKGKGKTFTFPVAPAPKYQNIQAEFGGGKPFVVQGDTLAVEMFMDHTLRKGQLLHFIYIVERFLLQFTERGGEVHLVFFDSFSGVLGRTSSLMLLARECLRLHMLSSAPERIHTWTFSSQWHPDWQAFITKHAISFAVTGDGLPLQRRKHLKRLREAVWLQELWFTAQQLSCTMLAGVDVVSNQILGFHNVASNFQSARVKRVAENLKLHSDIVFKGIAPSENYLRYIKSVTSACSALIHQDGIPVRLAVAGAACNVAFGVNKTQESVNICRLYLLHVALLDELSLNARAHQLKDVRLSNTVMKLMFSIFDHTVHILRGVIIPKRCASFADLIDLRLVLKLALLMDEQYSQEDKSAKLTAEDLSSAVEKRYTLVWEKFMSRNLPPEVLQISSKPFPITFENPKDLIDQRATESLASQVEDGHDTFAKEDFHENISDEEDDETDEETEDEEDEGLISVQEVAAPERLLLPIHCPLVDQFVGDIKRNLPTANLEDSHVRSMIVQGNDFDEKYHWHSGKPLEDDFEIVGDFKDKRLSDDPWERRRQIRNKQKFASYNQWYGETLEGDLYKAETIIVDRSADKKGKSGASGSRNIPTANSANKSKAKQKLSKKEQIIQNNLAEKEAEETKKEQGRWDKLVSEYKKLESKEEYSKLLVQLGAYLDSCKHKAVKKEAILYLLKILWVQWKNSCKNGSDSRDWSLIVSLVSQIHILLRKHAGSLTDENRKTLATNMARLGFQDDALKIYKGLKIKEENEKYFVGMSSTRFQLTHMGHHLHREERTDRDPRVSNFIPDGWQRELLDAVDNRQSALIIAPTSSGKTFASYYCIEKVLRESDDGVVVYVAPTKALVNQVAAVVYARFHRKKMPEGRAVFGTFTRDYRQDPLTSQVLITVPQCLEILLMSPKRQDWVAKMRYVIFDEIHCLGGEIGAEVWEHLLMMIRCPFLALSATVSNAHGLHGWLQSAADIRRKQENTPATGKTSGAQRDHRSYLVRLVEYSERHSDLVKHNCVPKSESQDFVPLHPIGTLSEQQLVDFETLPDDLSLSVTECLQLYDAMATAGAESDKLKELEPEVYFAKCLGKESVAISRNEVRQYEKDLKKALVDWVNDENMNEAAKKTLEILGPSPNNSQDKSGEIVNRESTEYLADNFMPLLRSLNQEGKLPCLVFMFDRRGCEDFAYTITHKLEKQEAELRESDLLRPMYKAIAEQGKELRRILRSHRDKESQKHRASTTSEIELANLNTNARAILSSFVSDYRKAMQQGIGIPKSQQNLLVPNINLLHKPLPNCTFASEGQISDEEWEKVIFRTGLPEEDIFIRCLKRGIAFHHAGLGNKRKVAVEILFRKKFLKVVVATGTLALGIHMPCKSVIFSGDSPYLTPIQYRQMSGRAGRRGYDIKGDVYFYGIADVRIQQLMSSGLPNIEGNFPVSATCVLRLMLLCGTGADKPDAVKRSLVLLQNPLMCFRKSDLMTQVRHHFLFCVQFLIRQGLLDETGTPQGLAGLATHIHYHEPANFVLVHLLQHGIFHKLCVPSKDGSFSEDVMRTMVTVLANLFGRRLISERHIRRIERKSSVVKLPSLPPNFSASLAQYNRHVDQVFEYYLEIVSKYMDQQQGGHDSVLPLTGLGFNMEDTSEHSGLTSRLRSTAQTYQVCSSFSALSGNTDQGVVQNQNSIPYGVYCESDVLPKLEEKVYDRQGNRMYLNAYALDFFKHGSQEDIRRDNQLMSGEVFDLLKNFMLVIKSIAVAVEQLGPEVDNVVRAFRQLRQEYAGKFQKAFQYEKPL